MPNVKYFNFPIYLLKDFLLDYKYCLNNILSYALYAHTLKLEEGDDYDKFRSSAKFYDVQLADPEYSFSHGEELFENQKDGYPKTGINTEIFWDFYKYHKSDYQLICLLAFLGIKSIILNKAYCKITNNYWFARIDGNNKSCDFNELSPEVRKYTTRHFIRKIKEELINNWGLESYGYNMRGFYISFKLDIYELSYQVERKKNNHLKNQKRKEEAIDARKLAIRRIIEENENKD